MGNIIQRMIQLPDLTKDSACIWGPRRTGKSYWLRTNYPDLIYIDLLKSDVFADYSSRPALLRERYQTNTSPGVIIIDEIQKCPQLLDEIHWLIENRKRSFILTGSSARKLRRSHANLLGGRALRREMRPLCFPEVDPYLPESLVISGLLPPHYLAEDPSDRLRSYIADYLTEEIAHEGATRSLPSFAEFMRVVAVTNGELLNYTNIAREVGVSAKVVRGYFQIIEDTLLGFRISPWIKSKNRRLIETEKFYLFDVGVANFLARRTLRRGTPEFGKAFEHLILMELMAYRAYRAPELEVHFWRTAHGSEVDFIIGNKLLAIKVKASERVHQPDARWLTALAEDGPVKKRVMVSFEAEPKVFHDDFGTIEVLPWRTFLESLWAGEMVKG